MSKSQDETDYHYHDNLQNIPKPTPHIDYNFWKLKNGTKIKIEDMSFRHIENCLSITNRTSPESPYIKIFNSILQKRKLEYLLKNKKVLT